MDDQSALTEPARTDGVTPRMADTAGGVEANGNGQANGSAGNNQDGKMPDIPTLGPSSAEVAAAAMVRVLLLLIFCLSVWSLVSVKDVTSTSPTTYFAVLAACIPMIMEWASLAKRKGKEWDFGWSPALMAFIPGALTVSVMMLIDTRDMSKIGNLTFLGSTSQLYGVDGLTLYIGYSELVLLTIGYLLLAAVFGAWWMGRGQIFTEHRQYVLLAAFAQALDCFNFIYSLMATLATIDDLYFYVCLVFALAPFIQFTFDPTPHVAKRTTVYNVGTGCSKCVSNEFVRIFVPLLCHEIPLFVGRVLMLTDPGDVFNNSYHKYIYVFATKNAWLIVFLFSWLIMSAIKGCADGADGTGNGMVNVKSGERRQAKNRELSANRRRIKAAIIQRNKVGHRTGYV